VTDVQQLIVGIVFKAGAFEANVKSSSFCWSSQCFPLDTGQVNIAPVCIFANFSSQMGLDI